MIVPRNTVDKTHFHYDINIQNLRFPINFYREGTVADQQPVRDVSHL